MNIAELYYKFNDQLIILVSGLSGTNKKKISYRLAEKFNLDYINLDDYIIDSFSKEVVLHDKTTTIIDWDDIESYDWNSFNNAINKSSKNLIAFGTNFPENKLDFNYDIHIHLKISKQKLVEKRHDYMKSHPDKFKNIDKILDTPNELYIVNNITYPHYLEYLDKSKINKYINVTELTENQVYDQMFDYIIYFIDKFIEDNKNKIIEFLNRKEFPIGDKKNTKKENDDKTETPDITENMTDPLTDLIDEVDNIEDLTEDF